MTKSIALSYTLVFLFASSLVFHLFVLAGIVPFEIVWGGRINSREELIPFEIFSILVNLLFLSIALARAKIFNPGFSPGFIKGGLWAIVVIFALNTIGNLLSTSEMEKLIFTPITALTTILGFFLARD
jgi:hypothetical protein